MKIAKILLEQSAEQLKKMREQKGAPTLTGDCRDLVEEPNLAELKRRHSVKKEDA